MIYFVVVAVVVDVVIDANVDIVAIAKVVVIDVIVLIAILISIIIILNAPEICRNQVMNFEWFRCINASGSLENPALIVHIII